MKTFEFKPPSDQEILQAQEKLGVVFPKEYIDFIKSGYDLGDAVVEALEITNPPSHADIYEAVKSARSFLGLPEDLLPICENNSDYYCLTKAGEVVYWSHNGPTDESWLNVKDWQNQMMAEAND